MMLTVVVNGQERNVPAGTTVLDLLKTLEIGSEPVAVEVNSTVVRRPLHAEHRLAAGDRIEIVTLVGGG